MSLQVRHLRAGVLLLALLIVLAIAIYDYFWIGSGIDHTIGDLIVICAASVLLVASALVSFFPLRPFWLRLVLNLGIVVGIFGSGLAGYFLETDAILAFLAVALLAWVAQAVTGPALAPPRAHAGGAHA